MLVQYGRHLDTKYNLWALIKFGPWWFLCEYQDITLSPKTLAIRIPSPLGKGRVVGEPTIVYSYQL